MPEGKTIGQLMEEMRQKAGAQNYHGHEYMDLERFAEDTRHMIIFDVLTNELLDGLFAVGCHRGVTASLLLQLLFLAVGHVLANGGFEQPAGELCSTDNQC